MANATIPGGGGTGGGGGAVSSVGLALPVEFTVTGSPVTTAGTLSGAWASAAANRVFAAPNGSAGTPAFRTLVDDDIPNILTVSKIANLTSNGFVKTSAADGTLSIDTSTYLTTNQTITLSGDLSGSGTTAITGTLATVNSNVGAFALATVTVNAKGLVTAASAASTTGSGSVVLASSPVITTPTIASFTNATHTHLDAAGGGTLTGPAIASGTVAAARLGTMTGDSGAGGASGAVPAPAAGDAAAGKFLKADATWATVTADVSTAVIILPTSSTRNVIQASGNFKALVVKNHSTQAVNLFEAQLSAGTVTTYIDSTGRLFSTLGISATNFIGGNAGKTTMSGTDVVAIGSLAGGSLTGGTQDVFIGTGAGQSATSGGQNVLIGYQAGFSQTTQSFNTYVGRLAGQTATGSQNSFFGNSAGATSSGTSNVVLGDSSADAGSFSGSQNTVIGAAAARALTSGAENVFIGYSAGASVSTGSGNLGIGYGTAASLSTGSSNVAIGKNLGFPSNTGSNQMNIAGIIWGTGVNDVSGTTVSAGKIGIAVVAPSTRLHVREISATAGVVNVLTIDRSNAGTPAANDGTGILIVGKSSTTDLQPMALISTVWDTATDASRKASLHLDAYDTAVRANVIIGANGSAATIGFLGTAAVVKQASGANLTNNVTSGGTDDTIANYTDLVIYANDAAAIRNDIYQLARKVKQVNDSLRLYGLLT